MMPPSSCQPISLFLLSRTCLKRKIDYNCDLHFLPFFKFIQTALYFYQSSETAFTRVVSSRSKSSFCPHFTLLYSILHTPFLETLVSLSISDTRFSSFYCSFTCHSFALVISGSVTFQTLKSSILSPILFFIYTFLEDGIQCYDFQYQSFFNSSLTNMYYEAF